VPGADDEALVSRSTSCLLLAGTIGHHGVIAATTNSGVLHGGCVCDGGLEGWWVGCGKVGKTERQTECRK